MYIFNSVLNIFGNDVARNISLLFTFADAQPPPALETVKKEKVPYDENAVFKFNNSAVYAKKTEDKSGRFFWDFGYDSLGAFFTHINMVEPVSLALTTEVDRPHDISMSQCHLFLVGSGREGETAKRP